MRQRLAFFKAPAALAGALVLLLVSDPAHAKPEIREGFFLAYPSAIGSVLDDVPSNIEHCGACHFRFNGGGPRNPFGLAVENRLPSYPNTPEGRRITPGTSIALARFSASAASTLSASCTRPMHS